MDNHNVSRQEVVKQILKVKRSIKHCLPYGELIIDPAFLTKRELQPDQLSRKIRLINDFGLYFIGANCVEEVEELRKQCDVYIFGLVPGPFTYLGEHWGYEVLLREIGRKSIKIAKGIKTAVENITQLIERWEAAGAQGIVLGDDICDQRGVLFGLNALQSYFSPAYKVLAEKISALGLDSVFHACGRIEELITLVTDWGYAGLHGFDFTCYGLEFLKFQRPDLVFLGGLDIYHCTNSIRSYYCELQQQCLKDAGLLLCSTGGVLGTYQTQRVFQVWQILQQGGWHIATH